jgi:putative ABC transport system permease protein
MMDIYQEGLQRAELLRNELADDESVLAVTASSHTLGVPGWARVGYIDPATDKLRWNRLLACDEQFLPLMGIDLVAGRNFSSAVGTDAAAALIVNQTMARDYGWEGFIDQPLPAPFNEFRLIGIVKDFHFTSLHSEVEPLAITMNLRGVLSVMSDMTFGESPNPKMTIKLAGGDIPAAIQAVETAWKNISPEQPFNFAFVDEALDAQYRSEQRLSRGLSVATLLAIFIAALGLFGIATLTTARRTKEIGVRKVMGATVWDIVLLLNRSISGLVLIATLIAAPLAWLLMRQWLSDFAYRVGISPLILIGAGVLALLIAWLAVSYQSLRAARTNPVEALRYE